MTVQRLRYLFGYTLTTTLLELAKTVLVQRNRELQPRRPPSASHWRVSAERKPNWRLLALVCAAVSLRVMHWVARQDESNATAIGALSFATNGGSGGPHSLTAEIPMPPPPPGVGRGCVVPPTDPEVGEESCPLCAKVPRVAECASTGGTFVWSYRVSTQRREKRSCPILSSYWHSL